MCVWACVCVCVCVWACVCVCQCLKHLVDMNYATEGRCDNSYLSADIKIKNFKIRTSFVRPERPELTKMLLIL